MIKIRGSLTEMIAFRYSNAFRGLGGWKSGDNHSTYALAASVEGETLTMGSFTSMNHSPSGNHGASYAQKVQEIIGLL